MKNFLLFLFLVSFTSVAQKPSLVWAVPLGTNVLSQYNTVDNQGNIYIAGFASSVVDFDPGPATYPVVFTENTFLAKYRSNGQLVWARELGFSFVPTKMSLCTDGLGNVYVSGTFYGTVNLGPGPAVSSFTAANADVLIVRADSTGAFTWAGSISSGDSDWVTQIKCDGSNNLYACGYGGEGSASFIDLDPGTSVSSHSLSGHSDGYIVKLDPAGNFTWGGVLGGPFNEPVTGLDLDASGNLLLAGGGTYGMDLDPGPGIHNGPMSPVDWTYLSKFGPTGNLLWTKIWEINYADARVSFDQAGDIALLCSFYGTVDVDPGPQTNVITSWKYLDAFVVKLDGMGQYQWARSWHDSGYIYTGQLKTDINNNIYVTGMRGDWMDFDPGPGTDSSSGHSSFVIKLDPNGLYQWSMPYQMASTISRPHIQVLNNGDIYVSVWYYGMVDLDPGPVTLMNGVYQEHSSALIKLSSTNLVSLSEPKQLNHANVFPNPSSGKFRLLQNDCNQRGYLSIRDLSGKLITTSEEITACSEVTLTLAPGIYLCTWSSDESYFKLVITESDL